MMPLRPPQLADIEDQLQAVSAEARTVMAQIGEARANERPAAGKWSVADCLVHLNLTSEAFFPIWQAAFKEMKALGLTGQGPFRMDFRGRLLTWLMEPPSRMRVPTAPGFQPEGNISGAQALSEFLMCQEKVSQALVEASGLALDRFRVASPFNQKMRYNVWSSFCLLTAHQRRHLWQAGRVSDMLKPGPR